MSGGLAHLSDEAIMQGLAQLVGSRRQVGAELILHLLEVDRRRLAVVRGYSSLYRYCIAELGFSEDEAYRRVEAVGLLRVYPAIFSLLQNGALTLSVLAVLRRHLTPANSEELFAGVAHLTVKQAKEWLAARFPRPDVPAAIRKLPVQASDAEPSVSDAPSAISRTVDAAPPPRSSRPRVEPLSSDRFLLKVTISRVAKDKLELARDLLRHRVPSGDLEAVVESALDALLVKLQKQRFGATERPRAPNDKLTSSWIPNGVRREVVARDGLQCCYVGPDGHRCEERAFLEYDHVEALAIGGPSTADNLRIYCRAHNALAADATYGARHMRAAVAKAREQRRVFRVKEPTPPWVTPFGHIGERPRSAVHRQHAGRTLTSQEPRRSTPRRSTPYTSRTRGMPKPAGPLTEHAVRCR
jgi:5-methylcytosine-specific restriction endonuclease McrA